MRQDTRTRLATLRVDIDEATAQRHLASIDDALAQPHLPPEPSSPTWRSRLAPILAGLTLVGAPVAAVAAESSVPGDLLYPIKQVTEGVRSWFDNTVAVDHRIDELETVIDRDESIEIVNDRLDAAERAVTDLPSDRRAEYQRRLDSVTDLITTDVTEERPIDTGAPERESETSSDDAERPTDRSVDEAPDRTTTTTAPHTTTSTTAVDRPTDETTTTVGSDRETDTTRAGDSGDIGDDSRSRDG